MRVLAPGKLLLAGAYAVLDGAPALVVAIDRYAVADGERPATNPTPEVLAALTAHEAPDVDASALREGAFKLGLGSSAAMLVASLGVMYRRAGKDLGHADVRQALFVEARRAHASVQGGGSGVDIAASVYGGALEYVLGAGGEARVEALTLPTAIVMDVFWCGAPAVTTSMRARVDALRGRDAGAYEARIDAIADAARDAISAARANDLARFVKAEQRGSQALAALGRDADSPIIPPAVAPLVPLAEADGAAFLPSGAGGGDVFVHLGKSLASSRFTTAAGAAGMRRLPMHLDQGGVRTSS
jgi:phosphomevalonate kinase